jgi:hypothetical protein
MTKKHHASASEKQKEDWMNSKWRPMMGWMYMVVCSFDFVIAPILWSLVQSLSHGSVNTQWQPLTLQGAGLFHIAMGAVLGIAAYGRTQEKLGGANNGGIQMPPNAGTTYVPPGAQNTVSVSNQPTAFGGNNGFTQPATSGPGYAAPTGFGGNPGFGTATVNTGYGGKKAPPQPDFPEI